MKRMLKLTGALFAMILNSVVLAQDALTGDDKEFLKNAVELGVTEVEMGKLAQQQGSSRQVKEHGAMIVAEHKKANDELIALAKSKGEEVKLDPAGSQKQMLSEMGRKSGEEFDKEYIEHQVNGHRKAIAMFQNAARDSKDPEIKEFATKRIPHLQHHLSALPGQENARTTGVPTDDPRAIPGKSEQNGRSQRNGENVKTE